MNSTIEVEEPSEEKPRTLFVGNIPKQVTKRDLETLFGDIGPLKRCFIQYPRNDGKYRADETTVAYVTYALPEDAITALDTLDSHTFGTNKITLKLAKSRTEQYRQPKYNDDYDQRRPSSSIVEKQPRPKRIKKKSRLIVRNLSFQANEENLREHFASYGKITDINILRKPNGKLVGCAFIQYSMVPEAAKALKELNSKPFLGRPIAIDWSLPKEKFQEQDKVESEVKEEEDSEFDPDVKIKIEPPDPDMSDKGKFDYVEQSLELENEDLGVQRNKNRKRNHDDSDTISSDSEDDFKSNYSKKQRKQNFNDAEDGKTLFIRNLEFETSAEDLKEFFEAYGPINYAVVCKDKLTEHPKGTAFVMLRNAVDASKCLEAFENEPSKFTLGKRQFVVSLALSKKKLETKLKDGLNKEPKDKRNLFLTREGFIRPGTNAAIGVSAADVNKRTAIQRVKKQMLKNLSMFVSDTRLCIHNLPLNYTDRDLRNLFSKHGGAGAKVTEARVMRNLQDTDIHGVGKSKEYGFVTFASHEHALNALRAINNNPKIFTPSRRPIVEFSLENRAAIKAKEKREEKSREKNQILRMSSGTEAHSKIKTDEDSGGDDTKRSRKKGKKEKSKGHSGSTKTNQHGESDQLPSFSGLTAKPGISSLPSLKPKGKITRKSLKPGKLKTKQKKLLSRRMREPQVKPKVRSKEDKMDKLISQHRHKIRRDEKLLSKKRKTKWYQ